MSLSFIGHISHVSSVVISVISHMLCSSIGEEDRIRTLNISIGIRDLTSVEVSSMVVIMYAIFILIRRGLLLVNRCWCMISRGRGMVSWGMVASHSGCCSN